MPFTQTGTRMNTIKLSPFLMIIAVLCTACSSEESTQAQQPEGYTVNGVFIEFLEFDIGPDRSTSARINVTNNTDYTANFLRCDSTGYLGDALVATSEDQDIFATSGIDLEPGQTRASLLIFADNPENTVLDRVEWVCSYRGGDDAYVIFEGNT